MSEAVDRFAKLPAEDALKIERQARVIDLFREFNTAFPASYMAAFLLVAANPGKPTSEYAKMMGMAQAVGSRLMLEIGPKTRTGEEGLGLIDSAPDPKDLRVKRAYLTPKGKALLRRILLALGNG